MLEKLVFIAVQSVLVPMYLKAATRGIAMAVGTVCILYNMFVMPGTPVRDLLQNGRPFDPTLNGLYAWMTLVTYGAVIWLFYKSRKDVTDKIEDVEVAKRKEVQAAAAAPAESGTSLAVIDYSAPRFSFDDVNGMADQKKLLINAAAEIVTGKKNGILFYGDPGNGKTFIAEAFAGQLMKIPEVKQWIERPPAFMCTSIADLGSRWAGQTGEQVREMFAQAAQAARMEGSCVLFIDEVDALLLDRNKSDVSRTEDSLKTVNVFLNLINRYQDFQRFRVILVMATNYRDRLDEAAVRDGRVDFKVEVPPPDFDGIVGLLTANCKAAKLPVEVAKQVAARWEGFSVARVRSVGERAGKRAAEQGRSSVTFDDLMYGLREAQGGAGVRLKAGTRRLDELHFDPEQRRELGLLANRLHRIVEIEEQGGTVPKGVMFYGPAGTGKTAVTQALALESEWAFLPTTGSKIMEKEGSFDDLVKRALDLRPCIVFIDEADDLLGDRAMATPFQKSVTNNLLAVLDGDRPIKDVMFVAATNHPGSLDPACLRRFPETFEFELPSDDALLAVIREFMKSKEKAPWDADFTAEKATALLSGQSPAMAREMLQRAINTTVAKLDGSKIKLEALQAALSAQINV